MITVRLVLKVSSSVASDVVLSVIPVIAVRGEVKVSPVLPVIAVRAVLKLSSSVASDAGCCQ